MNKLIGIIALILILVCVGIIAYDIGHKVGFDDGVEYVNKKKQIVDSSDFIILENGIILDVHDTIRVEKSKLGIKKAKNKITPSMKFEIEDVVIGDDKLSVTILKDELFSRDLTISKSVFERWVELCDADKLPTVKIFWAWYYRSKFFMPDLYEYIKQNHLVSDIVIFES